MSDVLRKLERKVEAQKRKPVRIYLPLVDALRERLGSLVRERPLITFIADALEHSQPSGSQPKAPEKPLKKVGPSYVI